MQRHFVEARYRLPMRRMVWLGCLWMWVLGAAMSLVWLLTPAMDDRDLALSGGPVIAHYVAICAGHGIHGKLVEKIKRVIPLSM